MYRTVESGAAGRGEDDALREGGGSALVAWSAVHGAFADVLRGMSPPAHTLLPGPEASPPGAAGGEA